jgi:hypothetical protein
MLREVRRYEMRWARGSVGLLGLSLALGMGACATARPSAGADPFSGGGQPEDVLITVENNDFRDANLYAVWNGVPRRVGSVTGKTTRTFRTLWRSEYLQFHVDFLGQGEYRTEVVPVDRGDHLSFVIMPGA